MLVRDLMTTPVVTVPSEATVKQAIRVLCEHDISAAPVVDATGRLAGIVSEMDLLRGEFDADPHAFLDPAIAPREQPPRHVADVMTTRVLTVRETAEAAEVAELMMTTGVKSVPVVRGGAVVGVVSRRDLMEVLARSDERIRDDVVAAIEELYPGEARWRVTVRDGVVELWGEADERIEDTAEVLTRTVPGVVRVVHVGPRDPIRGRAR